VPFIRSKTRVAVTAASIATTIFEASVFIYVVKQAALLGVVCFRSFVCTQGSYLWRL
jgi:predicted RNA binding protein with dsRBD fold (UPF0201 family)